MILFEATIVPDTTKVPSVGVLSPMPIFPFFKTTRASDLLEELDPFPRTNKRSSAFQEEVLKGEIMVL